MRRRTLLRRGGTVLFCVAGIGLAGCSGNGEGDGKSGGGGGGDTTVSVSGPVDGRVVANDIDELAVVSLVSRLAERGDSQVLRIEVTLQNTGDKVTSAINYSYQYSLFDASDTELNVWGVGKGSTQFRSRMEPGQHGSVMTSPRIRNGDPADVARYELTVNCSGEDFDDQGVYC